VRLFAGIPVPAPARSEITPVLADLQSRGWPVRWVRPEGIHLTLKFFGSVSDAAADGLVPALDAAASGAGPIPLSCAGVGSFPSGRHARVIWMGVEAPGTLELLQDAVERACVPLGFPVEGRPFRPHITLGRVKEGGELPPDAFADLESNIVASFLAEHLVLFESHPGKGGSVYTVRHAFTLRPCAAA
jgi:2'-5' RNA ligase